jgi:hypothetical protein
MSAWQYAQLTVTQQGRGREDDVRTVEWRGSEQGIDENFPDSRQTPLELMNKLGEARWELAIHEARWQDAEAGSSYWDASWSRTVYTFKRRMPE